MTAAKKRRKAEPASWWSESSTQAQRNLLKSLGVGDVRGLTRGQAAEMIQERKGEPPGRCWLDAEMDLFVKLPYT